eukprot:CRZ06197.1 hypothetical protein [Spongospora subterranea]
MCMMRSLVTKSSGHMNAPLESVLIDFYLMLASYGRKVFKLVAGNLPGPSWRHMQRISSGAQGINVIALDTDSIITRLSSFVHRMRSMGYASTLNVSLSFDATVVVPALLSLPKYSCIGGIYSHHNTSLTPDGYTGAVDNDVFQELASEIKVCVLTVQKVPKGVSPMFIVAARPSKKNDADNSFNKSLVHIVKNVDGLNLLSVCTDGVAYEREFLVSSLTSFMDGTSATVSTSDANHIAKSLQRALLFGGQFKFIGSTPVECCFLLLCNPPLSKDLIVLSDFASDLKVLQLCRTEVVEKILTTNAPNENKACLALCLVFLRLLISATNERNLDRRVRIAYVWSSLIWFHSVTGIHRITRLNLILHCIGSLFFFANNAVVDPRLCSEEPCEHVFGLCRMFDREFTVRGFCQYTDKVHRFFESACNSNLNVGGRDGKGYFSTLSAFVENISRHTPKRYRSGIVIPDSDDSGVTLPENPRDHVASRLFEYIRPIINEVSVGMSNLLRTAGVASFQKSKFCQEIVSFDHFRCTLTKAIKYDSVAEQSSSDLLNDHSRHDDSIIMEILSSRLAWALEQPSDVTDFEFPDMSAQIDDEPDAVDQEIDESFDADSIIGFSDLLQRMHLFDSSFNVAVAASKCLPSNSVSRSLNLQQHRSLQGRWYTRLRHHDVSSDDLISRGRVIKHGGKNWLILAVFKKGYSKFRLIESVPLSDNQANNVRLHCILVRKSAVSNSYSVELPDICTKETVQTFFLNVSVNRVDGFTSSHLEYEN